MKVVIQCAATKQPNGGFFKTSDGHPIKFVAHPDLAPTDDGYVYVHPDGPAEREGKTWRDLVAEYNRVGSENSMDLYRAWELYKNSVYRELVEKFGEENVFILSAGWGLVRSSYLTPQYDITFKSGVPPFKRRKTKDVFKDFCQISDDPTDQVVFFGGKDYVPLFCELTASLRSVRVVYHATQKLPEASNCHVTKYPTSTNWQYKCAKEFIKGCAPWPFPAASR